MARALTIALIGTLGFFFVGFVVYPLAATIRQSLTVNGMHSFENYRILFDFSNTANWEAVWNSVWVSALSVVLSGILGGLLALVVTQCDFPLKDWLERLAIVPIALPPLVGVVAFLFVFGETGILPRSAQKIFGAASVPFSLSGIPAIVTTHAYAFNVYFFLFVSNALRRLDGSLMEASAGLGGNQRRTFVRVILPQLRPALIGASALTFMASMASFSAPFLFGGEARFMTLQMYNAKLNGEVEVAAAQAIGLTLVSVLFFVALRISVKPKDNARTKGAARVQKFNLSPVSRFLLIGLGGLLVVIELLPILTIVVLSFAREGSWTWQLLPGAYTFDNYLKLISEPQVFIPIGNSLLMGTLTLFATVLVSPVVAYLIVKGRLNRTRLLWDILLSLPFALPGTVVALSLILAFNSPTVFTGYNVLVGTFWILPLAYFVRTYPLVIRSTSAALQQLDDSLVEAGKGLGASAGRRFSRIILPIILPGIISGALLTLITALGEFVSSVLLYSYTSRPISVEILAQLRGFNFGAASAYCVFLLLLILALTTISNRLLRRPSVSAQTPFF